MLGKKCVYAMVVSTALIAGCVRVDSRDGDASRAGPAPASVTAQAVKFDVIDSNTYASFIKNWNDAARPLMLASIRSQADWDAVFVPAATMTQNRRYSPDPRLYQEHQVLILSRVIPNVPSSNTFLVTNVSLQEGHIVIRYNYQAVGQGAAQFKAVLGVVLPRGNYVDATFIENGIRVGMLPLNR